LPEDDEAVHKPSLLGRLQRLAVRGLLVTTATAVVFGGIEVGMAAGGVTTTVAHAEPAQPRNDRDPYLKKIKDLAKKVTDPAARGILERYVTWAETNRNTNCLSKCLLEKLLADDSPGVKSAVKHLLNCGVECLGPDARKELKKKAKEWARDGNKQGRLDAAADDARQRVRDLREKAKADPALKNELEQARKDAARKITEANTYRNARALEDQATEYRKLAKAAKTKAERERLRDIAKGLDEQAKKLKKGPRNGGDDDGPPATSRPVKTPPKNGPGTPGAKKIPGTRQPTITNGKKLPLLPRIKGPRRGGPGAEAIGELLEQIRSEYASKERQKLFDKAIKDPKLRKRIIDEYIDLRDNGVADDLKRPFDRSKKFTPGELQDLGPKLIDFHTKEIANKSNSDPVYQKARQDCGGYETCVKERVKKLRKNITDAEKKAEKSARDPVYQKARQDCGGYETCVKERVKKLRKNVADAEKKAEKSVGDPVYKQAQAECGGYETCVQDRLKKLRAKKPDTKKSKPESKKADTKKKETKKSKK
jgi:hypothetical protein